MQTILVGLVLLLLYAAVTILYRLYLSPLAQIPGPKLAGIDCTPLFRMTLL